MKRLADLEIGRKAFIRKITTSDGIRRRLLDIGLIPNTEVICLYQNPFGSIKAYLIRGSVLAIRQDDASKIEVEFA